MPESVLSEIPQERDRGIVLPAVSPQQAMSAWQAYNELKAAIATPEDIQVYRRGGREEKFFKKSYWRKLARFFNLTVQEVYDSEKMVKLPDGGYAITVKYTALAPNGIRVTGDGHCGTDEEGKVTYMQIAGIAHTRAYNRAVSNCVGGGEVSAEEMDHVWQGANEVRPTRPGSPVSGSTQRPPQPASPPSDSPTMPFGSGKGLAASALSDNDLSWYLKVMRENVADKSKARFRAGNMRLLNSLEAEAKRRQGGGSDEPPFPDEIPEGAYQAEGNDSDGFDVPHHPEPQRVGEVETMGYHDYMALVQELKDQLKEETYYFILGQMGLEHANEVRDLETMKGLIQRLRLRVQAQGSK